MNSSCELPPSHPSHPSAALVTAKGSRIHRFCPADRPGVPNTWTGVPLQEYKPSADHHCGVQRAVLVGAAGEAARFQVRYFEVAAEGFTTLEHHQHEHVVVILRGHGEVCLDGTWHAIDFGDAVYVAPHEVHQLRNTGREPFGFLCLVDADRDQPIVVASVDPAGCGKAE